MAFYARLLRAAPLRTNLLTTTTIMGLGDCIAQRLERGSAPRLDAERTATMVLFSGAVYTPTVFFVYRLQERLFNNRSAALRAAQKAVFSVAVGGVPVNAVFVTLATVLEMRVFGKAPSGQFEGSSLAQVLTVKLSDDWPRIVERSFQFWVPINFVNFYFVPLHWRLVVTSLASVGWNCFLSLVQHEYVAPVEPY